MMKYRLLLMLGLLGLVPVRAAEPGEVLTVMEKVADWQLANPSKHRDTHWAAAAGHTGMMALAGISSDDKYIDAMVAMGERSGWELGPRHYYADDHCVGQTYAELYFKYRDPEMIAPLKASFDDILANPRDGLLQFKVPGNQDRWSWCDALFMAPPAWVQLYKATGNEAYLDFMIREWWETSDYLYDDEEHLYYRDSTYFDKREANGKKVFWGRGNGWVMGGLVRVLQYLPDNHPSRERFVTQYKEMASKLLSCQQADGMWRASLLDPESYPLKETSSTGFYTYALAWGVNQGLLDRAAYQPAVLKAWKSLVDCVAEDGKLTHVQPIGADPQKFPDDATEIYGVGAFLLAGTEIYRMGVMAGVEPRVVTVTNTSAFHRLDETIEVAAKDATRTGRSLGGGDPDCITSDPSRAAGIPGGPPVTHALTPVMDAQTSAIIDSQWEGGKLLFKVDLAPGETRRFLVLPFGRLQVVPAPHARTFCRFVPERMDDFAWENDRTAYRMYGPALVTGEGTVSSGIDVWSKSTRRLVINDWYAKGEYHADHGEGGDFYKVGPTRGCGGLGIWDGKQLHVSGNFVKHKVLSNGPLRSSFELSYDTWDAAGRKVTEVKRISIDAGSHFSNVESTFTATGDELLQVGVGITKRKGKGGQFRKYDWHQLMAYWEPKNGDNGHTACAVIARQGFKGFAQDKENFLILADVDPDKPLVYQIGSGWSKSGDFANFEEWLMAVHRERQRLANPLVVKVEVKVE